MVGKLMYLACETRPDIAFVVGQLNRYNSDLWVDYIHIAKHTFWYLKRTSSMGIVWGKDAASYLDNENQAYGTLRIVSYIDNSYIGGIDDWKSITGYCFFLVEAITT